MLIAAGSVAAENRITSIDEINPIDGFVVFESRIEEGIHALSDVGDPTAEAYDGGALEPQDREAYMLTFRTDFTVDTSLRGMDIAFLMDPTSYPYVVYLNGTELRRVGRYAEVYHPFTYDSLKVEIPDGVLRFGGEKNRLAIEIFPRFQTIPLFSVSVADGLAASRAEFWRNLVVVGFSRAAEVLALVIGLFFGVRALMGGAMARKDLYFALFSFAFSMAYVNIAFNNEGISALALEKVSRIGFSCTLVFLVFFFFEETGILNKNRWVKGLIPVPGAVLALLVLFQRDLGGVGTVFDFTMNLYLAPLLLLNLVVLIIKALRERIAEHRIFLAGYIVVLAASGHDIVFVLSGNIPYAYLVPYGFCVLLLTIFFILAAEQTRMYKTSQAQAVVLNRSNEAMAEVFRQIDGVSDTLSQSVRRLETVFESGRETIRSFGESNQGLISDIRERVRGVEAMTGTIETKIHAYAESINESLANQSGSVSSVSDSVTEMNQDVTGALEAADGTSLTARRLAELAAESIGVMEESRKAVASVAEYSNFINDVLRTIKEISENTNLLSINAAIEAARVGVSGKGFGIVAAEIGDLATQSKTTLETSFQQSEQIKTALSKVIELSNNVSESILSIREGSKQSSKQIDEVREHVSQHVSEFSKILSLVTVLNGEMNSIKETADEQRRNNVTVIEELRFLGNSFADMGGRLAAQLEKGERLEMILGDIGKLITENLESIHILEKLVERENLLQESGG